MEKLRFSYSGQTCIILSYSLRLYTFLVKKNIFSYKKKSVKITLLICHLNIKIKNNLYNVKRNRDLTVKYKTSHNNNFNDLTFKKNITILIFKVTLYFLNLTFTNWLLFKLFYLISNSNIFGIRIVYNLRALVSTLGYHKGNTCLLHMHAYHKILLYANTEILCREIY